MGLRDLLGDVHARHARLADGEVATYIPELGRVSPDLFAVAAATVDGQIVSVGDDRAPFTLQSLSKPFVYGLALGDRGPEGVHARVGVDPTGDPFNSLIRLEQGTNRPHNPMVNAGAIAVASLVRGASLTERFNRVLGLFRGLCGRPDVLTDMAVYLSERAAGHRNRAIAHLMRAFGMVDEVEETLDLYLQQCSVLVTARDLAVMAATLAHGGVNPLTGERVLDADVVPPVLAVMFTCGLYDAAGRFAFEVGLPAKSGVSGGILAVVPGRLGIGVFSPRLDAHGNSVRGLAVLRDLSRALGVHAFDPARARPRVDVEPLRSAVEAAHEASRGHRGGAVADYIPELARIEPEQFGLAACTVAGEEVAVGSADTAFTLQAAAQPFTYALALARRGEEIVHERVGVEPSGNPFHDIVLSPGAHRPFNPLTNAGAIAVCGLIPGQDGGERLRLVLDGLAALSGSGLPPVDRPVFGAEKEHGHRNRAIASLLRHFGVVEDEAGALELYFQQCAALATCRTLARMGATLAAGGREPRTGDEILPGAVVQSVLSVMSTCGMHEASGRFAFEVGLPAKSGISGAVVAVAPGRLGVAAWSPRVDEQGNSVRGMAAIRHLARALGLGLLS